MMDIVNINDGYLSDVLTQHSVAGSDISHDLLASTKALELHFKKKYTVLRGAYEERIKKMNEMINTTCCSLLGDELIKEMKKDRSSSLFIPAHVNEIIERHLDSDREVYIHNLLDKLAQTESSLKHKSTQVQHLQSENQMLFKSNEHLKHEILQLKQSLLQSHTQNEELIHINNQRSVEIQSLEQSFHHSARELQLISSLDEEENRLRSTLQSQIMTLKNDKNLLSNRVESLLNEIKSLKQEKQEFEVAQTTQKTRLSSLLQQVESTLEQEVNESNEAISSVFAQMKTMKNRLLEVVHREKHTNLLLTDEIHTLTTKLQNCEFELKKYKDENFQFLQSQKSSFADLQKSQEKTRFLEAELQHEKSSLQELQTHIIELQSQHKSELQKVEFLVREECAQEARLLEQVTQTQKLQMENEALRSSQQQQQQQHQSVSSSSSSSSIKVTGGVVFGGLQKLSGMSLEQAVEGKHTTIQVLSLLLCFGCFVQFPACLLDIYFA